MVGMGDSIAYDKKQLGGKHGRVALALGIGNLIIYYYCANDGKDGIAMEGLQTELYELGAETAMGADGGGSAQGSGDGWDVRSSDVPERPVHNYLCIWLKKESKEDKPMSKTVCLDPGHGPGCVNGAPDGSYKEYEFAWDMGQRVKAHLERCGVKVVMTKDEKGYPELTERAKVSDGAAADLLVSLHTNADGSTGWGTASGLMIYTSSGPDSADRNVAAHAVIERLRESGVAVRKDAILHQIEYTILRAPKAPAILIEYGFHTNKEDVALLKTAEHRSKLAEATAKGACDFLGVTWADEQRNPMTPGPWYEEDQKWVKDHRISDGTRPDGPATRAEVWAMLRRLNE